MEGREGLVSTPQENCYIGGSMSTDMFDDIKRFHQKFNLPGREIPGFLEPELLDFRKKFLQEELNEFADACELNDLVRAFDALIDLVYVALGTAWLMNMPFDEGWAVVHAANMRKVRANRPEDSKRGSTYDVVKPAGWIPPEMMLQSILFRKIYIASVANHEVANVK